MSGDRRERASREATLIQRAAADPARSVSLRASAGSGKTKVLVDRIVRLLLVKAPLKSVVALTFTRKAAVEIKERLRDRLGELARLDRTGLAEALEPLLGRPPKAAELERAAVVYEEVLEDASGLLVGTIHTFCQTLLKRFADEAGVDPAFAVLENTDDLWDEALAGLEAELGREKDAAADLAELTPDPAAARRLLRAIREARLELDRWCDRLDDTPRRERSPLLPALAADLAGHLFRGTSLEDVEAPTHEDIRATAIDAAREYAAGGMDAVAAVEGDSASKSYVKMVRQRRETVNAWADDLAGNGDVSEILRSARDFLFYEDGRLKVGGNVGSKVNREAKHEAMASAAEPMREIIQLSDLLDLHRRNHLWLRFGLRALDRYADLKRRDRCLDFHDLEREAWRLIKDMEVGPWILYRLDARLDHLLVDEFQDTNRNQWEILRPFAREFLAGPAEDGRPRSAFFVGDVKQSIYGFRGARPGIFAEAEALLARMTEQPALTLPTNFRSLPAIVETVGEVFGAPPLSNLLPPGEAETADQIPHRDDGEGLFLITAPVDGADGGDPHETAAARARRTVERILREGRVVENGAARPARYGDILLLARTRTHLAAYETELRRAGIPVVPAGRGALARSREVQDVLLLLRWLVFPADDAALASVLRSPLFRVGEAAFQRLLSRRLGHGEGRGSLWQALKAETAPAELSGATALLQDWLGRVGRESVHRLLRRVYRDARATRAFGAALGEQARYNLLRLHDMALAHDRTAFPSVRGFLAEVERAAVREDQEEAVLPDSDRGRVRMMTIHGAKGLEAPFVLLVDHAHPMDREPDRLVLGDLRDESGPLVTGLRKSHRDPAAGTIVSRTAERAMKEIRREQADLLYVALTRARDELIALGAAPTRNAVAPSFARWLSEGPRGFDETPEWLEHDAGGGARATRDDAPDDLPRTWEPCGVSDLLKIVRPSKISAPPLPENTTGDWEPDTPLATPETADGMDEAPRPDPAAREAALAHGIAVHAWLQRAAEDGAMPPGSGRAWEEARAVFGNPAHAWIFRPEGVEAHCEVPVIARRGDGDSEARILGVVDRLLMGPDGIVAIDYKSNRLSADGLDAVVDHYRPQMAVYGEALAAAYPGRPIRCVLLFANTDGEAGPGLAVELT